MAIITLHWRQNCPYTNVHFSKSSFTSTKNWQYGLHETRVCKRHCKNCWKTMQT